MIRAWRREIRLSSRTRSLSVWRPRVNGVRVISTSRSLPEASTMTKRGKLFAIGPACGAFKRSQSITLLPLIRRCLASLLPAGKSEVDINTETTNLGPIEAFPIIKIRYIRADDPPLIRRHAGPAAQDKLHSCVQPHDEGTRTFPIGVQIAARKARRITSWRKS